MHSKYFLPGPELAEASKEDKNEDDVESAEEHQAKVDVPADAADTAKALDGVSVESNVPDLPDVPTTELKQPDEPESKVQKIDKSTTV